MNEREDQPMTDDEYEQYPTGAAGHDTLKAALETARAENMRLRDLFEQCVISGNKTELALVAAKDRITSLERLLSEERRENSELRKAKGSSNDCA